MRETSVEPPALFFGGSIVMSVYIISMCLKRQTLNGKSLKKWWASWAFRNAWCKNANLQYWLLNQLLGSMSKKKKSSTSEAARVFETTTLNFRGNNSRATMTPYSSQDVNSAPTSGSLVLCNFASFIKDVDTLG